MQSARPAGKDDPVPREITAGCGLSWTAPEEGKEILAALQTAGLRLEAEYRVCCREV